MYFNPISLHDFGQRGFTTRENNYNSDSNNCQTALQTMEKIEQYLFEKRQHNRDNKMITFSVNANDWGKNSSGALYFYAMSIRVEHEKAKSPCCGEIVNLWERVRIIYEIYRLPNRRTVEFETRVNKLIELGMKIETENASLLEMALRRKCFNLAQNLLKKGANPNFMRSDDTAFTMMHYALGNPQMINALIQAGANVNQVDPEGRTLLISACLENKIDVIRILLSKGANVNYVGEQGSALQAAISNQNERAVVLLAEAQVDVDQKAACKIVQLANLLETDKTIHFIQVLLQNGLVNGTLKDIAEINGNFRTLKVLTTSRKIP